jgi:hypothetical protein
MPLVFLLLIPDARSDRCLVRPHRRDKVASSPEVLTRKISLSSPELRGFLNGAHALDIPHDIREPVLPART